MYVGVLKSFVPGLDFNNRFEEWIKKKITKIYFAILEKHIFETPIPNNWTK